MIISSGQTQSILPPIDFVASLDGKRTFFSHKLLFIIPDERGIIQASWRVISQCGFSYGLSSHDQH